ncbi:helix-turn-helix transcriptional regulator [Cellulomonas composti]|uniref:Transcriptional regulator n=1 Tax=Cellulomonas composti TaxID=266130 RepID=A0A511J5W0_9CELL|nr:helix-turn-helix domain-containing protein [Cellulomonas composti]GEL93361.1 transcriptional regulator [Cellulomonas composti]
MSTTLPLEHTPAPDVDAGTRQRVLELVVTDGPITASTLAERLDLTPAAIRRHILALEQADQISVHESSSASPVRRGRPARRYVVTNHGQAGLAHRYAEIAQQALDFLRDSAGAEALDGFARARAAELTARIAPALVDAGSDVSHRAEVLANALTVEGYAASARPVPGTHVVQLCQGHCPVQDVAHEFPQLCEAETKAISDLLGVHVQRLSTLAAGGHVCTTSIPTVTPGFGSATTSTTPPAAPATSPEGTTR